MDRNRMPWTQVRLPGGWLVDSSLDPFVYTEKDTNNLMHRPGEKEKEREI